MRTITVRDEGEELSFTWESLYSYCGPTQIIASALVFRLLELAFRELSPGTVPDRSDISFLSSFGGKGIAECVELVTRLGSRNPDRYLVDTGAAWPEAPDAAGGKLYFEVQVGSRRRGYWPAPALFDDVFRDQVGRYQEGGGSAEEREAYRLFKRRLAEAILAEPDDALFRARDRMSRRDILPRSGISANGETTGAEAR